MSRGDLIRIRHDQLLSEPRPHILTGVEDPHSGAVGASTVEKDDYDDDLVFMDDPEERKKVVSSRPDIMDDEQQEPLAPQEEVLPCLERLYLEREKQKEAEYLKRLEEMEALEEEEGDEEDDEEEDEEEDENSDDADDINDSQVPGAVSGYSGGAAVA